MRTTVHTDPTDPDETDEWPACSASVDEDGSLAVVDHDTSGVETIYAAGEWVSFTTVAREG